MECELGEEGATQELEPKTDTAESPMQQSPDQSDFSEEYRSPEATGTDMQGVEEQGSGMEADHVTSAEKEIEPEKGEGIPVGENSIESLEPMSDDENETSERVTEDKNEEMATEDSETLKTKANEKTTVSDDNIEKLDYDEQNVNPESESSLSDKGDTACESLVEHRSRDIESSENCDVKQSEAEVGNSAIYSTNDSPNIEDINSGTDNAIIGGGFIMEDDDEKSEENSDIQETEISEIKSDFQNEDDSNQNFDIHEVEHFGMKSDFQDTENSDKNSDIQEVDISEMKSDDQNEDNLDQNLNVQEVENSEIKSDIQDRINSDENSEIHGIDTSEIKSDIQKEDYSDNNSDIQDIENSDIEDIVETSNVVHGNSTVEQELNDIIEHSKHVESLPDESTYNGAKVPAIEEELRNVDDNSQAESNDLESEIYDVGPQELVNEKSETEIKAYVEEELIKPEEARITTTESKEDEKDEGELSEASLEEVSDEEDEKDNKATESGIEEVSDEEEEEDEHQGNVSGVEEVSDEEDDDNDEVTEGIVEVDRNNQRDSGKDATQNKPRAAQMIDDKVRDRKKKAKKELEEGEEEEESGMEEVSEEEDDEKSDSDEEAEDEDRQKEEGSEGMEDVSSEEEEDHTVKETKASVVTDERTVEIKQNGEVVKIDDTGKDDSAIVQEILEDMTIKIDNVDKPEKTKSSSGRKDRDKQEKDKSRKKKDRRESVKSRTSSSGMKNEKKDTRDINERLKAQASYGEDVELDYDDVHDEMKDKAGSESGGLSTSESDEGELIDEEDCEEGEIREPGQKPFIKPTCRFFMRGHCTWGANCRFLHPGINDKGYYQLIERPGFNNKPPAPYDDQYEDEERSPSPEPPPPAKEPKEETAWERGLRQAKELRKKALERRELDTNFEHKKMNLSIEENPEFNKENTVEEERSPKKKKKPYYYEKEVFSDDEYYDQTPVRQQQKQQQEQSWMPGQYENFEVRWTRDSHYPPPQANFSGPYPPPPQHARYSPYEQSFRGRDGRYQQPRAPQRQFSPSPPPHFPGNQRYPRMQRDPRMDIARREKARERLESPPPQKPFPNNPSKTRADEWHDPWRRSNANKPKSPVRKRSRSRGRRRSRRSHSYSSSYSSSSYSDSSRSRSRSSSYSSVSSRSRSRSRSSSASSRRSSPRRNVSTDRRRHPPGNFPGNRRFPQQDHPRSTVGFRGQGRGRSPDKRPGMNRGSPMKGMNKGPMPMQPRGPMSQGRVPGHDPRAPMPQGRAPMAKIADVGRRPDRGPQQQRKFQMEVKQRDRQLPPSGLKDKRMASRRRTTSVSRSRSRSSSRSSSSRSSSYSRSSSGSRSSSSSSSGSADSDHLYRNIGGKDNQKPPAQRGRPAERGRYRHHPDGRQKMPPKPDSKGMVIREGEFGKPMPAIPQKPKDPLKVTGQKSNIKLTLIKPSDKSSGGPDQIGKKRPADHDSAGPPPKRPTMPSQAKPPPEKIPKKIEKANPVSPTKPLQSPVKAAAPPAQAAVVRKKSTVNRREELLKQLKAVEDAIAKKKKKMT